MTDSIQYQANQLVSYISDSSEIGRVCDRIARARSGTKYWSPEQFERSEDTAQYDLYWAVYSETQVKIVTLALSTVANCHLGDK